MEHLKCLTERELQLFLSILELPFEKTETYYKIYGSEVFLWVYNIKNNLWCFQ